MKKILIALLLITAQIGQGQDCKTRAMNRPSESVRFQDSYDKSYDDPKANVSTAKMKPQLTIAENWVKGILKNFTGAKLMYSNKYLFNYTGGEPYKATGIKGYYWSQMSFFEYYCYEGRDEIFTEGESGSRAIVYFNYLFPLAADLGTIVNGKYTFKIFEKSRTEGRIDFYEQIAMANVYDSIYKSKNEFIIIRNSDKPVFLPVTRKEYLQQLIKNAEEYKRSEIAFAKAAYTPEAEAANKARFDAELKRIDNSKTYTPEQMAPYRKRLIETWETEKQKYDKRVAKVEAETNEAIQVLQEYQKKPGEWLNRTIQTFYWYTGYTGRGMKEYLDKLDVYRESADVVSRTYVVSLNPDYFNKSLSADVPQVLLVYLAKGNYPHMKRVSALVNKPGALKPLETIFTPGKQSVEQPLIVSNYKLSYLKKLDKLTPLVVPADMKPSTQFIMPVSNTPVTKLNFEIPAPSQKLIAQVSTPDAYKNYILELHTKISNALDPAIKKKADEYLTNKKLTKSVDIGNAAFSAWLQNAPEASLYMFSKAVAADPSDALTANNFSAFLMMSGLPEKSVPILEFWNKQKPGESTLLGNLGNAYYRLGDMNNAMKYLQQCVQKDSLHAAANKILCLMYLKKGDVKKAEEHGTRTITKTHDEEVISILRQLNSKAKPGEIMSRYPPLPMKEFPMLKRIQLPMMPANLDDMEQFSIELNAMRQSLNMTIDAINAKYPIPADEIQQKALMASLKNGISPIRIKAQKIIMDGLQHYQSEGAREAEVFNHNYKKMSAPHNTRMRAIMKKYDDQLNKLEGGEAGDEDKIQALELAKCKDLNEEKKNYLPLLATLVNQYAQRQEYLARKFYRDYANWAPYWVPETNNSFPSIEADYLRAVSNILSEYKLVSKTDCSVLEPLPGKEGALKEWDDEYCANFKGKVGVGPAKFFWTCNSWGIDGGEGFVGTVELNYSSKGEFENFTIEGGVGANFHLGGNKIGEVEAGASAKEFLKIGKNAASGKWEVQDFGVKSEIAVEGSVGNFSSEIKLIESTVAVKAGVSVGGIIAALLNLK